MKKISAILLLFSITTFSFSQIVKPDTSKREYKNVIALDATGILKEVFNFGPTNYIYSPYIISYRRIMKSNALRILVGGNVSNGDNATNDTIRTKNSNTGFDFAVGFEHYSYLGKRWNYYYGIDLLAKYSISNSESISPRTIINQKLIRYGFGVSPLIGVQFRISSRLSVSTEASYNIMYTTFNTKSTFNFSPYTLYSERTAFNAQFNAPLSISFRIQF
jgi:hypothetical protein